MFPASRVCIQLITLSILVVGFGCGRQPYELAPVSGRVTLNQKPLAKAWVYFAPMASKGTKAPGPTSHGQTDADGRFTLSVDGEHPGAVVGKHRVFISTRDSGAADQPDAGINVTKELVPDRYNQETTLTHDVPPGGSTTANFDLTSP
jgi:hypothetical protein